MSRPTSQHYIALLVRALLILLCVFAIPKLASSEGEALTDQDIAWSQRPKVTHEGVGHSASTSLRLFAENKDCAVVKLDIWLQRGTVTHSASLSDGAVNFRTAGGEKGRTMIIGGRDCRIRVRIEAVPADTSIFD
jgi:hypothetical protein